MLLVGLTGGIATGKSTVSKLLSSQHNISIIDADVIARQVVKPRTKALSQIVSTFGPDILTEQGTLNRPKLGQIIFNDPEKREILNKIVHPAVYRAMLWTILKLWITGHRWCILDVPLLIESGLWKWVAKVVVVYCPTNVQLERLMKRDDSKKDDASSRLKSQMPIYEKATYADEIIDNSGTVTELEEKVSSFAKQMDSEAGWSWILSWICPPLALINGAFYVFKRTRRAAWVRLFAWVLLLKSG